jgi:hypothetical protein
MAEQNTQIQRVLIKPPLKGLDMHTDPLSITEQDARELINYMPPTTMLQVRPAYEALKQFQGVCLGIFSYYNGEIIQIPWEQVVVGKIFDFPSIAPMNSRVLMKMKGWLGEGKIAEFDPLAILNNPNVTIKEYGVEVDSWKEEYVNISNWLLLPDGTKRTLCVIYQPKYGFCATAFKLADPNDKSDDPKKTTIATIDQITLYRNYVYFSRLFGSDIFYYDAALGSPEKDGNWEADKSFWIWERDQEVGENAYMPTIAGTWSLVGITKEGGYILKLFQLSVNSSTGSQSYLAIMMNTGELILYGGMHPVLDEKDTTEFKIVGQWNVPIPLNSRCICEVEGETFIATENGFISLNRIAFNTNSNITMNIEYKLTNLFDTYSFKASTFREFFFLKYMAERRLLFFNVPTSMSFPLHEIAPGFIFNTDNFLQFPNRYDPTTYKSTEINKMITDWLAHYTLKYMLNYTLAIKFVKTDNTLLGEGIYFNTKTTLLGIANTKTCATEITLDLRVTENNTLTNYNLVTVKATCTNYELPIGIGDPGETNIYITDIAINTSMLNTSTEAVYFPQDNWGKNVFDGGKEVEYIYPSVDAIGFVQGTLLDSKVGMVYTYRESKTEWGLLLKTEKPLPTKNLEELINLYFFSDKRENDVDNNNKYIYPNHILWRVMYNIAYCINPGDYKNMPSSLGNGFVRKLTLVRTKKDKTETLNFIIETKAWFKDLGSDTTTILLLLGIKVYVTPEEWGGTNSRVFYNEERDYYLRATESGDGWNRPELRNITKEIDSDTDLFDFTNVTCTNITETYNWLISDDRLIDDYKARLTKVGYKHIDQGLFADDTMHDLLVEDWEDGQNPVDITPDIGVDNNKGGKTNYILSCFKYEALVDTQSFSHYNIKDVPFVNAITVVGPYKSTQYVFNTQYGTWAQWEDLQMATMFEHAGNFFFIRQEEADPGADLPGLRQYSTLCRFNKDFNLDDNKRPINVSHLSGWADLNSNLNKQIKKVKIYGTSAAFWRDQEIPKGTIDETIPYFDPDFPSTADSENKNPVKPFYEFLYALDFKDPNSVFYQHYLNLFQIQAKILRHMGKSFNDIPKFTTNELKIYKRALVSEALRVQNIQLSLLNVDPASKISIGSKMAINMANVIIYGYELYYNLTNFY